MAFQGTVLRDRRNFLNQGISFNPMHYSIANYGTDAQIHKKTEMETFEEDIFNKIQSIPDPLKKNLADTVITSDNNKEKIKDEPKQTKNYSYNKNMTAEKMEDTSNGVRNDFYPSFTGLTSFFSNFFGAISGAVFHRRPKSPASQYYDCFECDTHHNQQMSSNEHWQTSNPDVQNKTQAPEHFSTVSNDNMSNCRAAVAHCEDKLNSVRSLLANKTVSKPKIRTRRPRRVFVQPGSVEDGYQDKLIPDNFVSLSNADYVEYLAIPNNVNQMYTEIDTPIMKTELGSVPETTDIVKIVPEITNKLDITTPTVIDIVQKDKNTDTKAEIIINDAETEIKKEVITSCEDKMAILKSLLQEKRKKPKSNLESFEPVPEPVKEQPKQSAKAIPIGEKHDKRFKNPNRLTDKRKKSNLRKNIQDDLVFANEIDSEEISSADNSPAPVSMLQRISETVPMESVDTDQEYFDELKGRFHSASTTDSEDSFQIVFTDSPKLSRMRRPSDCDSDFEVVFEDSPDSCYMSNDVFGDHLTTDESDADSADSESEVSDSGCGKDICKLSHSFSRTVSDLTDDTLYEDSKGINDKMDCVTENDEVDCAVRTFDEIPEEDVVSETFVKPGLLIDEAKKKLRKEQPPKKVTFSEKPPKVHVMRVWSFAARQARAGHWERHALDRERFKRRIADVDMAVSWVLKPQHRSRVMFQRFMPWWNAQKRKEAAEKKLREEEEKKLREEERIKEEERLKEEELRKLNEEPELEEAVQDGEVNVSREVSKEEVIEKNAESKCKSAKLKTRKIEIFAKKAIENSKIMNREKNGEAKKEIVEVNDKLKELNIDFIVKENVLTN